jgi:hypothetical protein
VGAEALIERIEAELAGEAVVVVGKRGDGLRMTKTQGSAETSRPTGVRGPAWALASLVVMLAVAGLIYFAFSGDDGQVAEAPTTTSAAEALVWDPGRVSQAWPGPLRPEPAAGDTDAGFLPLPSTADPVGDAGLDQVDIDEYFAYLCGWLSSRKSLCTFFDTVALPEPLPHPADTWIAYGIVVDYTGDGRGDVRFGIDNAPDPEAACPADFPPHLPCDLRMFKTFLETGETLVSVGRMESQSIGNGLRMWAGLPEDQSDEGGSFQYGGVWVLPRADQGVFRFYFWAAAIQDGEIVATDYAPDTGWIGGGTP